MNLILLQPADFRDDGLAVLSDERVRHIRKVLKAEPGKQLRIGLLNGPYGTGTVERVEKESVALMLLGDSDTDELFDRCDNCPLAANTDQNDWDDDGEGNACDCCEAGRGDANGDGSDSNILDLTFIVDYVFRQSGDPGPCASESDANADGSPTPNILDLTYFVDNVFRQGPKPTDCPL